jgi:hypothetical protein
MVKSLKNDTQKSPVQEKENLGYDFSSLKKKLDSYRLKATFKSNKLTIEFSNELQIEQFLSKLS